MIRYDACFVFPREKLLYTSVLSNIVFRLSQAILLFSSLVNAKNKSKHLAFQKNREKFFKLLSYASYKENFSPNRMKEVIFVQATNDKSQSD